MLDHPRISIAVPSFNQAAFIRETLESLVAQDYPNLEVLVQDGGSTDGAVEIAREFVQRYPGTFQLDVQKDRGHAHAVNMAFARSTGEILGYLNTDDTLLPGCLHSVAREIDPARGRYIVFGRCLFTGEGSSYVGIEHPAEYTSHFEYLAVWKRGYNTIPQPSTFWHRLVHETCGGFDERHNHGLDYLQWCRFGRRFHFHKVDELWSTYRMHPASVSSNKTEQEWLDIMIRYSRMNWGPRWRPLYWRCAGSHWLYNQQRHEQARHHARRAEAAWRDRRYGAMLAECARTAAASPRMAWHRFVVPVSVRAFGTAAERLLLGPPEPAFTGRYPDHWIGPLYRDRVAVGPAASRLTLRMVHAQRAEGATLPVTVSLLLDGSVSATHRAERPGPFTLQADVAPWRGRDLAIEVRTAQYFVPRVALGVADDRQLSVLLHEQRID